MVAQKGNRHARPAHHLRSAAVSGASEARVIESARAPDGLDRPGTEAASCWFAAFEAARDAMVIIDDDRRYVHANVAACELLGVDANGLIGRRVDEFALAATRDGYDDVWASLLRDGHHDGEYELVRADGSRVAVESTIRARVAPGLHLSIMRDVTERKTADELLARQRRQLIEAQAVGRIGSWEWDLATNAVEWSDELRRIYGLAPATVLTLEKAHELTHPDDRGLLDTLVEVALATHEPFADELRIVRPDATVRVIEARGEVVLDDSGTLVRMIGTAQDITDRKQAEAERRNVSTVLDASADAITTCSRDRIFVSWNHGAEKLYGYTADEAIGQPVGLVIPPEQVVDANANMDRILSGGLGTTIETTRVTKDGRTLRGGRHALAGHRRDGRDHRCRRGRPRHHPATA